MEEVVGRALSRIVVESRQEEARIHYENGLHLLEERVELGTRHAVRVFGLHRGVMLEQELGQIARLDTLAPVGLHRSLKAAIRVPEILRVGPFLAPAPYRLGNTIRAARSAPTAPAIVVVVALA